MAPAWLLLLGEGTGDRALWKPERVGWMRIHSYWVSPLGWAPGRGDKAITLWFSAEGRERECSHSEFIEQENSYAIYENRKGEGGVLSLLEEKCASVAQKNGVFDCCQARSPFKVDPRFFSPGRQTVLLLRNTLGGRFF